MGDLFSSKKFQAALIALAISLVVFVLNKVGVKVTDDQLIAFLAPVLTYIGAQGVADLGKSKAQIDAGNTASAPK